MIRDRDEVHGEQFRDRVREIGMTEVLTAPQGPLQNAWVEKLIGSIGRECLDRVIVFGVRRLGKILQSYFDYYQKSRTHLSLSCESAILLQPAAPASGPSA